MDFNSRWLGALGADGLVRLAARYNVAQMLERRDFRQRFEAGKPIAVHEFLYPLAQAYDSVFLKADVELGGTDQLFNLNVGRDIMPGYGLEAQVVMTTPLLEGLDGVEKMSKSLGNYIGVTEAAAEMFGKVMSVSDELMWRYYLLLTDESEASVTAIRQRVTDGCDASQGGQSGTRPPHRFGVPRRGKCHAGARRVRGALYPRRGGRRVAPATGPASARRRVCGVVARDG